MSDWRRLVRLECLQSAAAVGDCGVIGAPSSGGPPLFGTE
jgi:hypothetical protein